jgi:hypothetical protein
MFDVSVKAGANASALTVATGGVTSIKTITDEGANAIAVASAIVAETVTLTAAPATPCTET